MLIEPELGRRPEMVASSAEWVGARSLGFGAISSTKMEVEGYWSEDHILLGFTIDVRKGKIALHREKAGRARRLLLSSVYGTECKILTAEDLQELRGHHTHWVWKMVYGRTSPDQSTPP